MDQTLNTTPVPVAPIMNPKDEEFFVERLAQILLMQLEHEHNNEYEKETRRISKTV